MDINQEKVEQTVLALLYLTSFKDKFGLRAWKGHDWEVMNFLHEKGYISNPATKAKSVAFTDEGAQQRDSGVAAHSVCCKDRFGAQISSTGSCRDSNNDSRT